TNYQNVSDVTSAGGFRLPGQAQISLMELAVAIPFSKLRSVEGLNTIKLQIPKFDIDGSGTRLY
ncbi:hypothetical protein WA026_022800, partial [Henosepilachna vigintioctopunctata]